ncbi:aminodeoxychorismate synthase component I [Reichenbachiella ulvae]|uniref:Aminodeoxychorismate synthase component I n=1 Tax=Reichenbachiella ulvae TaxID=2980104 RepID=A0ABT3CPH3_9BACT|nr:aminodeoxychorismate synthase component I [Reichenbachiella ulvae]MCV9385625.1 aminodeoxychorismate synthase component I [Reichenbachiella ulvae]
MLNRSEAIAKINDLASQGSPFLFISDFKGEQNHILPNSEIKSDEVLFQINGHGNASGDQVNHQSIPLEKSPLAFDEYQRKFEFALNQIKQGNSYLLNLTCPTPVRGGGSLKEVFYHSNARYRLWFKDKFVVFSPEIFIQINDGVLASYPMKGTIDADLPNAREQLLNSEKEMAEHATIVDLIRNDMSIYARNVTVEKFRYIDEIKTNHKHLLQASSKITGKLEDGYLNKLGDIIFSLLPAGSISGAPKPETLEIIQQVEGYERGYYTGVMGYFDGKNFDSGVMIRFIENQNGNWVYKSGGGIHALSDVASEYQEMIDKVYVPIY